MSDLIKREDALNALSHGNGCGNICSNAISRIPTAAETLWTLTSDQDPPKGEPLIVTIQAKWKEYREYRDYNKRIFSKAEPEKQGPETKVYEENVISTIGRTIQDRKNDRIAELLMQIIEILKE